MGINSLFVVLWTNIVIVTLIFFELNKNQDVGGLHKNENFLN